jgi:hypothetical protein
MIKHDHRWSLPCGNSPVPSRWQATGSPSVDALDSDGADIARRCGIARRLQGGHPDLASSCLNHSTHHRRPAYGVATDRPSS